MPHLLEWDKNMVFNGISLPHPSTWGTMNDVPDEEEEVDEAPDTPNKAFSFKTYSSPKKRKLGD